MGIGVVLVILGLGAIAIVQNWSPMLSLIFFGNVTIPFPLGIWLLFALGTGILISLLLQGLNYRPAPRA
ncbi:MAG: LapA family protein, partial [Spirulina sp. DLM2.Bin59]